MNPTPTGMFLSKDGFPALFATINKLEATIGLPQHFVENLVKEDDWSFVIKLHALLEGALTMLLVEHLGGGATNEELRKVVSHVPMSEYQTGKVQWALALGLLTKRDRRFMALLSEFRNSMAHRIEMVGVTLAQHIASFDTNKRKSVLEVLCPPTDKLAPEVYERARQSCLADPKPLIWALSVLTLLGIKLAIDVLTMKRGGHTEAQAAEIQGQIMALGEDILKLSNALLETVKTANTE